MAAYTGNSELNSAIIEARKHGAEVLINNLEIEVYFSKHQTVGYLYGRSDLTHMAELLRDLREMVEASEHGF